jgi:DNA-binding transcriptional LysR family regulator
MDSYAPPDGGACASLAGPALRSMKGDAMKFDMLGVQAFVSIVEAGSFQRAATSLNVSQTALSHRLRKFETDLGFKLVARTTRRINLTPAGQHFVPKARRLLADAHHCIEELRAVGARRQDVVSVGCLPSVAASLLPKVLHEFNREHCSTMVRIFDRVAPDLTELLRRGEAEVAFTVASALVPELEFTPLVKQTFVALCPVGHPLSHKSFLSSAGLVGSSMIRLGPNDPARILIDQALGKQGRELTWRLEVQQMTTAIALVESGMGVAIVPRLSIEPAALANCVPVPLVRPQISTPFGIITRRNVPLSPAADALAALFRRLARRH